MFFFFGLYNDTYVAELNNKMVNELERIVGVFMACFHFKFYMLICNVSFLIAVRLKAKANFLTATTLLFYI
jgi:hypothetical protein